MTETPRDDAGAYGLRVRGLEEARDLLVAAEPDWPLLTIERTTLEQGAERKELAAVAGRATLRFTDGGAEIGLAGGAHVLLDRTRGRATFVTPSPLRDDELVHPYLGAVAAVFARWRGRDSFHAGAFAAGDGAWGLVAGREGGKSSLLAWLAGRGIPIVCDDVLVLDGRRTFPGPRSIDLREEPARQLGVGEPLGVVGVRERWRLQVAEPPPDVSLRGWILLAWGPRVEVSRVGAGDLLARIAAQVAIALAPTEPRVLLDLAALPAFELRRPRGWDSFDAAAARLLELVG